MAAEVSKIREDASLNETEKYHLSNEKIEKEINSKLTGLTLKSYFEQAMGIVTSQELIEYIECNLGFWRKPGKFSRPSLPDSCDNLFKVRLVDNQAGVCFTLFHETVMKALKKGPRLGLDDFWKQDEKITEFVNTGEMTPVLYPENGLLHMRIDFNMRAMDERFNDTFANESTDLSDAYGGKFWIHSNRVIPKLSMTGYTLRPGKHYVFYIKRTVYNLLPPPFVTGCRNYTHEYLESEQDPLSLAVPISREACIDECIVRHSVNSKQCSCWPTPVPYRRDNQTEKRQESRFCENTKSGDETCYSNFVGACEVQCAPDCRQDFYEMTIKEKQFPSEQEWMLIRDTKGNFYHEGNMEDIKEEVDRINPYHPPTIVDIVFATTEETYHNHYAKINMIDLIVNIAGLLGLFLSLSADASIDFLEFLIDKFILKK